MNRHVNELGQPIGYCLRDWSEPPRPPRTAMHGRTCRVEPLDPEGHGGELYSAYGEDHEGRNWTYMPYGPFASLRDFHAWMERSCLGDDPLFHAIVERDSGRAMGLASYLRIAPSVGTIEVGHINYAPALQGTIAGSEAMYLMMRCTFEELGYRRYEWKCDALNETSRRAAERLGFTFEGIFRQATIYKGRNRDTAWYAVIDREWPALKAAYTRWLDPGNFDESGRQRARLSDLTRAALQDSDQDGKDCGENR